MANRIRLLAVEAPSTRFHPGEEVPVTLYLSAPAPLGRDYELFIQLLDENSAVLGNVTTHPGWGRNPTTLWQPGAIYADRYLVPITAAVDPDSPLLARLYAGFVDPDSAPGEQPPLTARDAVGAEITPVVAAVEVAATTSLDADELGLSPVDIRFGEALEVAARQLPAEIRAGETLTVTVLWEAAAPPATDYTAFVHLLDGAGNFVAGYDRAPAGERFPTSRWQAGDRILSRFPLTPPRDTPAGDFEVWLGLYTDGSSGAARLPVTATGGAAAANDMVKLGDVTIR